MLLLQLRAQAQVQVLLLRRWLKFGLRFFFSRGFRRRLFLRDFDFFRPHVCKRLQIDVLVFLFGNELRGFGLNLNVLRNGRQVDGLFLGAGLISILIKAGGLSSQPSRNAAALTVVVSLT